jgi:hypothetical protein
MKRGPNHGQGWLPPSGWSCPCTWEDRQGRTCENCGEPTAPWWTPEMEEAYAIDNPEAVAEEKEMGL